MVRTTLYGESRSLAELAKHEKLPKRYVTKLVRLAFISPTIVEEVVQGCAPAAANLQMLMDGRLTLPLDWDAQKQVFAD